jgi:hypothetical protein
MTARMALASGTQVGPYTVAGPVAIVDGWPALVKK